MKIIILVIITIPGFLMSQTSKGTFSLLIHKADSLFEAGELNGAQFFYQQASDLSKSTHAHIQLRNIKLLREAESLMSNGEPKKAERLYKKIHDLNPESILVLRKMGAIAYEAKDWGKIKKWYVKILEIDRNDSEANFRLTTTLDPDARRLAKQADSLFILGNYEQAEEQYKQALRVYEHCFEAFQGLANLYYKTKNLDKSTKWFNKVVEI